MGLEAGRSTCGVRSLPRGMTTATLELTCDPSAAFHARRWVMQQHLRWAFAGRGGLQHLFDDIVLCVSELVTTAVEADSTRVSVSLDSNADRIRLCMTDHSADAPAVRRIRQEDSGRRVRILDAVATRWGVHTDPETCEIWIEFVLGGDAPAPRARRRWPGS